MLTVEIVLIALALSIDAFAVSVAAAAAGRLTGTRASVRLSFHFGLFQFLMPVLGWGAGSTLAPLIAPVDHLIAFILLVFVGIRMIRAGGAEGHKGSDDPSRGMTLVALSTATSIDALAVGLSLAALRVEIWIPSTVIGIITAIVSFVGIMVGGRLNDRFGRHAEIAGGIVLILIAVRIVISHLTE